MVPDVAWLLTAGLVAVRILAALTMLPVFGMAGASLLPRVFVAIVLAVLVAPHIPAGPVVPTLTAFLVGIGAEVLVGVILGALVRLVFDGLALAGHLIGTQIGQEAAAAFDPTLNIVQGPLGRLSILLGGAVFLGLDLHLEAILAVANSFWILPPGRVGDPLGAAAVLLDLSGWMWDFGVRLAAPVIVLVFLNNLFIAAVMRLAPQMNIFFSLGFILTIFGGQTIYLLSLPHILNELSLAVGDVLRLFPGALRGAGP